MAWPNHMHHSVARAWFATHSLAGWATCGITESGFVRVSSNPALVHAASPAEALGILDRMHQLVGHEFLEDDVSLATSPCVDRARILSYRQVTDAHLLAVARRHGCRLATLDAALVRILGRGDDDPSIVVLSASD